MIPEREREALMRLTMCARRECRICMYQKRCDFDFRCELATKNMNILADALRAEQTEPQCEKCKHFREEAEMYTHQCEFYFMKCKFEPKTENCSEKTNNCEDCRHYNPHHEAIACERCLDGKYSRYEPKDEPKPCEWCKFYDGENCFSQEPCKVMLYLKTEPQTERSK